MTKEKINETQNQGESELENESAKNNSLDYFKSMAKLYSKLGRNAPGVRAKHRGKFTKPHRDIKAERKLERQRKKENRNKKK